jgi:hypothetical protein
VLRLLTAFGDPGLVAPRKWRHFAATSVEKKRDARQRA